MPPLDPCRLSDVASINRAMVGDRAARDLLSAPALARLAGLPAGRGVRSTLDRALSTRDPAAEAVAAEFGRRLGDLLAALRGGDRDLRPEWDDSWWDRWAGTTTVWLGGGLAGGPFGARVAAVAETRLATGCRVVVADQPEDLPLVGAARLAPPGGLVLDFGHTLVKRAVAGPTPAGIAAVLRRLAPVSAPREDATGADVAAAVADIIGAAREEAGDPEGPVVASMAAYVIDGLPVRTRLGLYTRMADLGPGLPHRIAERAGVPIRLVHDGTAAAQAVPPDPHAVVVLLGTSLGVGYPPDCPGLV
jgi:hypothetical protein